MYGKNYELHYKIEWFFFPSGVERKKQHMIWSLALIFLSIVLFFKAFL